MTWKMIPGWSTDITGENGDGFYRFIESRIPHAGVFVEVGVFLGRSFAFMGELRRDIEMWAVDPWRDNYAYARGDLSGIGPVEYKDIVRDRGLYSAFMYLMRKHAPEVLDRAHVIPVEYGDMEHPLADMVFIDADHTLESGRKDLRHAASMLKPGGILAGHDYIYYRDGRPDPAFTTNPLFPGLVQAIDEFAAAHGKVVRVGTGKATDDPPWSTCWRMEDW